MTRAPSFSEMRHMRLDNIIRKYSTGDNGVILGVYGTHVHSDSFKIYYENGTDTGTSFCSLFSFLVCRIILFIFEESFKIG